MGGSRRRTQNVEELVEEAVADLATETAETQITTTISTPVRALSTSASGVTVIEADGTEYQPTPPRSRLFATAVE